MNNGKFFNFQLSIFNSREARCMLWQVATCPPKSRERGTEVDATMRF